MAGYVLLLVAAAAAATSPASSPSRQGWESLTQRWNPQSQLVNDSAAIIEWEGPCTPAGSCAMVAIQTGPVCLNSTGIEGQQAAGRGRATRELRFRLCDDQRGVKTRIEATNCFVTAADLARSGIDPQAEESQQLQALHFVYQNCSGALSSPSASVPATTNLSYSLYLPPTFSAASQAILGQWHGRPDPRWFFDPRTNTTHRLSTAAAFSTCRNASAGRHGNCEDGQVSGSGLMAGWKYKQGGYPPLTFAYQPGPEGGG
jgi:hypothetical protein